MFEQDLSALPTRDLLEQAAGCRAIANQADADLLECAQIYADRFHPSTCPSRPTRYARDGRERAVVLGGDGCPEIAEFAVAEFAMVLGVSPGVGRDLIADALALRHRFPLTWAQIQAGAATPWKARQIVRACSKLDHAAAEYVDRRVAAIIDTLSPYRLDKIVQAAKLYADPQRAAADAAEAADERGVFVGRGDKHGNKTIYIKAPAAAVNRHDMAVATIAEALKTLGDTRPLQQRRAQAIEILPDPRYTQELLAQAGSPRPSEPQSSEPRLSEPQQSESRTSEPWTSEPSLTEPRASEASPAEPPSAGGRPTVPTASAGMAGGADATGVLEPLGPPDDPWLEAAGPDDPDPLADPFDNCVLDEDSHPTGGPDEGAPMDAVALRALNARLAQIKQDAYANPSYLDHPSTKGPASLKNSWDPNNSWDPGHSNNAVSPADLAYANNPDHPGNRGTAGQAWRSKGQVRPGKTEVVVHLTDHTLASGTGVLRAESIGPLLAAQLTELVGHGPYVVKPVIDLNDAVSVNAYEIPTRIRERVKLTHPVELFPYGTRETTNTIDLDHIEPYDPLGPPGQTSTTNLAPLGRFGHRVKTHGRGWTVHRVDDRTLEWTTPHGFRFRVDPSGTHRVDPRIDQTAVHSSVRRSNAATVDP